MEQFKDGFLRTNGAGELSANKVNLNSSAYVADKLPTASGGTGQDFSSTAKGALLTFAGVGLLTSLAPGSAGYVLTSNGLNAVPTWEAFPGSIATTFANLVGGTNTTENFVVGSGATLGYTGTGAINASQLLGQTWAVPGAIGATTPSTGSFTQLIATGATYPLQVGAGSPTKIDNNGRMTFAYSGDSGSLSSSGGVFFPR